MMGASGRLAQAARVSKAAIATAMAASRGLIKVFGVPGPCASENVVIARYYAVAGFVSAGHRRLFAPLLALFFITYAHDFPNAPAV
jgi:hypothetical protein